MCIFIFYNIYGEYKKCTTTPVLLCNGRRKSTVLTKWINETMKSLSAPRRECIVRTVLHGRKNVTGIEEHQTHAISEGIITAIPSRAWYEAPSCDVKWYITPSEPHPFHTQIASYTPQARVSAVTSLCVIIIYVRTMIMSNVRFQGPTMNNLELKNQYIIKNANTLQLWDRRFRRNSSLQAVCDTPFARITSCVSSLSI